MTLSLVTRRLLLAAALLALTLPIRAQSPSYFIECTTRTGTNATLVVPAEATISAGDDSIAIGDEIAVFNAAEQCAGVATWTGKNIALPVWGTDEFTSEEDGLHPGERMRFRIWDASERQEYGTDNAFTLTLSRQEPYLTTENHYVPDGIYVIDTLRLDYASQASR